MKARIVLAALLIALPAAAQAMDVGTFLTKFDALEKKGMLALLSSDYRLLRGEMEAAIKAVGDEAHAAKVAGRPTAFCPPHDVAKTDSNEILASFRAIPPAQRAHIDVRDALRALLARKYPCR
jgi:hypothetical protein